MGFYVKGLSIVFFWLENYLIDQLSLYYIMKKILIIFLYDIVGIFGIEVYFWEIRLNFNVLVYYMCIVLICIGYCS